MPGPTQPPNDTPPFTRPPPGQLEGGCGPPLLPAPATRGKGAWNGDEEGKYGMREETRVAGKTREGKGKRGTKPGFHRVTSRGVIRRGTIWRGHNVATCEHFKAPTD